MNTMSDQTTATNDSPRLFLKQIQVGPMANYVYLIGDRDTRKAVIVDPAWNIDGLLAEVENEGFELEGALVTHYHPDHIGGDFMGQHIEGIGELLERQGMKIYIHKEEAPYVRRGTGLETSDIVAVDGETEIKVGDIPIRFIHTPGHTPGSQCFLVGDNLVSGDTLFIGACGRVDLPGSNPSDLYYSLTQKLAKLPDDTILLPGHDYASDKTSTIGREKRSNPYMRFARLEDYLQAMGLPG
ncbi:MAG: hydroxyacylglutathione hydrolase [Candidatus Binatia bacterium]